jgi:hypothetical protein
MVAGGLLWKCIAVWINTKPKINVPSRMNMTDAKTINLSLLRII